MWEYHIKESSYMITVLTTSTKLTICWCDSLLIQPHCFGESPEQLEEVLEDGCLVLKVRLEEVHPQGHHSVLPTLVHSEHSTMALTWTLAQ